LYEALPEDAKSHIHTNKEITEIDINNESGVTVACADGTTFIGSIIIGADGINSRVRSLMRDLVLDAEGPKSPHLNDENPFEAKFMLLYGDAPRPPDLKPGMTYDMHGTGRASSLFVLRDRAQVFVYTRLDKPTRDRSRQFTQDEIDEHAEQGGDYFVAPGLRFRDFYKTRYSSGMTLLHEGVVPNWTYGGRVALAGDSAHKLTTNLGFGLNSGIDDVVTLANHLYELVASNRTDRASLEKSFKVYESERLKAVPFMVSVSGNYTSTCLWSGWMDWLLDRWVIPVINGSWYIERYFIARIIAHGNVLDFVEEKNLVSGTVPWKNRPKLIPN
jgi:2-polyprenyl-6-methoxyphenol hydroxylase-like FAD-dependent oxidoreductase